MQPFLVSVVIPVYNAERFLRKAVQSALEQPQTGEVILVEDASPDNALALCQALVREHPDKVRLFTHPGHQNLGAGPSRNLGIRQARYEYVAFLDADDYYLPGRFRREEELFRDESVDGVYGALGIHYYSEEARKAFMEKGMLELVTLSGQVAPEELIYVLVKAHERVRGYFHGNCLTVRKRIFEKAGYFNDMRISQDSHMWMRMAMVGRLLPGEIDTPIAVRGVHEENRITRINNMAPYRQALYTSLLRWGTDHRARKDIIGYLDAHRRHQVLSGSDMRLFSVFYLLASSIANQQFRNYRIFNPSVGLVFGEGRMARLIVKCKEKVALLLTGKIA